MIEPHPNRRIPKASPLGRPNYFMGTPILWWDDVRLVEMEAAGRVPSSRYSRWLPAGIFFMTLCVEIGFIVHALI